MKKTTIILALIATCLLTGCQAYKDSPWTPSGANYTLQRDRTTGEMSDYFGLSWDLK